ADALNLRPRDPGALQQLRHRGRDLPADALATRGDVHSTAPQPRQGAVARANAQLQLRAADLDAEEHRPYGDMGNCHSQTVPSLLADRPSLPSGEMATPVMALGCSRYVFRSLPVSVSHRRTVLSQPPERACLPSGENVTQLTPLVWPARRCTSL